MNEIKYPLKRTFWKITGTGVKHEGYTDTDQVTTTGQPTLVSNIDATTIYPALPASGTLLKGAIYSYNKGMVRVEQDHTRTAFTPEATPNLFSIYRANTVDVAWIEQEKVIAGDTRIYKTKTYKCIQSHQTQTSWNPELTLGVLWSLVVVSTPAWTSGVAYKVNDIVTYLGKSYKCLQAHTAIPTWNPVAAASLWKLL